MSYLSIDNLYKPQAQLLLSFKKLYALEKIHGTSAHIHWSGSHVAYFSGGEPHTKFKALFDDAKLTALFLEKFSNLQMVTIYGEAYGGKQQRMSHTYGKELKFVAFDVKIGDSWLNVPNAHGLCTGMGLDFVDYELVDSDLDSLNFERDRPSMQAEKCGIEAPMLREGVVLRPPFECYTYQGRLIAKHKGEAFTEREKPVHKSDFDPEGPKAQEIALAEALAQEWASPMRLEHVIDHIIALREDKTIGMEDTKDIITEMVKDIQKEWESESEGPQVPTFSQRQLKAIGTRTASLLKLRLQKDLEEIAK